MKKLFCFLCAMILLCLTSCFENKEKEIVLDNSDPLALAVDVQWALVTDPYISFKLDNEWSAAEGDYVKKGEILRVVGYSFSSENERWVKFEKGFLPEKSVTVFSNKFQAQSAKKKMAEK